MFGRWVRVVCRLAVLVAIAAAAPVAAQTSSEADKLNAEVMRLYQAGKYAEAMPVAQQALAISEKALGPEHPSVGTSLNNLAELYRAQGRFAEAEPLFKRTITILETALGPDHPSVGTSLNNLAELYRAQGRYAEAEPLYKRTITIFETALGPEHPAVARSLNNLAALYRAQGRYAEADPLYKRTITILETALGPEHPDVGTSLNNLAELYQAQGRFAEAEPLYKRSLAVREMALGPEHPNVGTSLNNLAALYRAQGRYAEAEPLYKRSLALREKALGLDHPSVGASLNNLAELYQAQGRYVEAEPLFKRTITILETALGPDHPSVGTSLNNLAWLALAHNDFAGAAESWRRATALLQRRAERGLGDASAGSSKGELQRKALYFEGLVKTTHRLAATGREVVARRATAMFETAQWGQGSEAAASLAQMAARSAGGSTELAGLVRERQDLVSEWSAKDKQLIAARSEPPAKRNVAAEAALSDRLATIDGRLATIDTRLAKDFPDYAALASPRPISVLDVQTRLREDEALVLFLDTGSNWAPVLPEETFIWVVTKTDVRWLRSDLGTATLDHVVAALRCGLDATAWQGEGAKRCAELLKLSPDKVPAQGAPLPFDVTRAHVLYKGLLGEAADLIKGKRLLVVPSGALATLPFQVLVTEPPAPGTLLKDVRWLARDHAITVLPSVSSLKALRRTQVSATRRADRSMIGFGNPTLQGVPRTLLDRQRVAAAAYRQACDLPLSDAERQLAIGSDFASARASLGVGVSAATVLRMDPIPGTAKLLCDLAGEPEFADGKVLLGRNATKGAVQKLNETGELARYRIVHFATHGLLPRPTAAGLQPGLVLTPVDGGGEDDDGYLTAADIAGLKLDADAVILSACNTAAAGDGGGEALSGLARAFIYAQARSLVVSHWEVDEQAAVELIFKKLKLAQGGVGLAEAQRQAILELIASADTKRAHPSYWAPFVVVGEGGAGR